MKNKKYVYGFMTTLSIVTILATAVPALADNTGSVNQLQIQGGNGMMNRGKRPMMNPGVFGTVSAVSGNIITLTGKQGFGTSVATTPTTFMVDATNAKIMKNNVLGTITSILVGDTIMAQGTLTGTNLIATMIRDGQIGKGMIRGGPNGNGKQSGKTPPVSPIIGNGQPVVAGTVSIISGSTITITNKSNVSYTIDATNAKVVQGQNTITVSGVTVGDMVIAQGTINGNSVVATSVIDQAKVNATTTTPGVTTGEVHRGFFGSIGHFFSSIFGF